MIEKLPNHAISLNKKNNHYELFTYERLLIQPNKFFQFKLPYRRFNHGWDCKTEESDILNNKYLNIELDKSLILKGLSLKWSNINEESARDYLEFIIKNENSDEKDGLSPLFGSRNKVDIRPDTLFARVYF